MINSIYLLHLATCTTTPVEPNLITYSVDVFTQCMGKLGMNEMLPNVFYTQAFEYVGGILTVAKAHQIQTGIFIFPQIRFVNIGLKFFIRSGVTLQTL